MMKHFPFACTVLVFSLAVGLSASGSLLSARATSFEGPTRPKRLSYKMAQSKSHDSTETYAAAQGGVQMTRVARSDRSFARLSQGATIEDHTLTSIPPSDDCTKPPLESIFLPTDDRVYHWTLASGVNTGDVVRWEWIQPDGALFIQNQLTFDGSGSFCFWAWLNIAGAAPAELPGNWQVHVFYNDVRILTEIFTIQGEEEEVVLQVDDGSFERNIGFGEDGRTVYCVNRLTPPQYPATLSQVAIYFLSTEGGPQLGDSVTVLVGANTDGDTNIDGTSFQAVSASVQTLDALNVYDVPEVTITSGDFVVGFRMTRAFPCAQDSNSASQRRSYFSSDGAVFTIIDDADPDLAGNWGIRASVRHGGGGGGRTTNEAPTLERIVVTRVFLSHGRFDGWREADLPRRPIGIRTRSNPSGRCVPGITPEDLSAVCQENERIGLLPPNILDAIAAQPNPRRVTLNPDEFGSADKDNPLFVAAEAGMPSCFTLAVAEGVADPDADPVRVRWELPGVRFGDGNIYATVDIPEAGIVAGMELTTQQQLDGYDANSLLWEAPDVGPIIQDSLSDGGTESPAARVIDFPPAPLTPRMSPLRSRRVEFAQTIRAEIEEECKIKNRDGSFTIRLRINILANPDNPLDGRVDPLGKTVVRWAVEATTVEDIVRDIPGSERFEFTLPKEEGGKSIRVTAVASSFGPAVDISGGIPNPFLEPLPVESLGLDTFKSRGCTISDTESVRVVETGKEICGDGLDNDCDGDIDEDCDFRLLVEDNQCPDDTIGVSVDGQDLGQTPTGGRRFFDISQFTQGEHSLVITAIASGGEAFGCSPDPIVSFGVQLIGGAEFVRKNGQPFTGTTDSGEINVGTRIRYTINLP